MGLSCCTARTVVHGAGCRICSNVRGIADASSNDICSTCSCTNYNNTATTTNNNNNNTNKNSENSQIELLR